jgi:polyisoprenoid-binding protein YceI
MKSLFIILSFAFLFKGADAQMLKSKSANISFFSKTAMEDIAAKSDKVTAAIDITKRQVAFRIPVSSFLFKEKLMGEHFNENYLETEKYPVSTFEGTIQENIDLKKDGIYNVTVKGKLILHGVTKEYTTKGTIAVKGGQIVINSVFKVALKDHKIKVPKLVVKNIAEVIEVTVNAGFNS